MLSFFSSFGDFEYCMPSAPSLLLHVISLFCLDTQHVICLWWASECALLLKHLQLCVVVCLWFFLFRFGASSKAGNGNGISTVNQVHWSQLWQLSDSCHWPLRQVQHHHSQHICPKQSKIVVWSDWQRITIPFHCQTCSEEEQLHLIQVI